MLSTTAAANPSIRNENLLKFVLFALLAIYLAECFTPLRLHYDSVRYLAIKDCIELGCPPDSDAAKDYFPFGYTALLLILSKLGILGSFSIVLVNCLFLLGCLYFTVKVFDRRFSPYLLFVLILLNWLFLKFVAHPLSEMQYLFFSMGGVYFFYRFAQARKVLFLLLALLFCWLAFVTKSVGITLIGAIAIGLIWEFKESQMAFLKKNKFLIGGVLLLLAIGVVVFSKQLGLNHYIGVLNTHLNEAPFMTRVGWRFIEWGEIFLNTPANKVFERLPQIGEIIFIIIGLVIFVWFCFVLFSRKAAIPVFIRAYFIFYCVIMFNWPFNDPRFWVPVMPVMAAVVLHAPLTSNKILRLLSRILLTVYVILGLIAAGYMLYSTFNRPFFAKNQANAFYKKEYDLHFFTNADSSTYTIQSTDTIRSLRTADTIRTHNPYILGLLNRYSPK